MFTEVLSITYEKKKIFQQPGISEINYETYIKENTIQKFQLKI